MTKQQVYHSIEWTVALAACAFLIWKLATYEDYAGLWTTLRSMSAWQWLAIGVCVALMPLNMTLEAWRWKTLIPMSWREAHRQVYYSKLAGLITPWRLGEYPARGVLMEQSDKSQISNLKSPMSKDLWTTVLSMGAVGSATMTAAIVIAGVAAMMVYGVWCMVYKYYLLIVALVLLLLGVALYFAPRLFKRWAVVSHKLVAISFGQSFVRLVCWCVQLGLVVWALGGGEISLLRDHVITNSFIYYLLVTITPNVPIAEVGVRGAWAITVFGSMNAALAGVLLWVINTLLPCLIWPFIRKKQN
jgi:hypothetical protein